MKQHQLKSTSHVTYISMQDDNRPGPAFSSTIYLWWTWVCRTKGLMLSCTLLIRKSVS